MEANRTKLIALCLAAISLIGLAATIKTTRYPRIPFPASFFPDQYASRPTTTPSFYDHETVVEAPAPKPATPKDPYGVTARAYLVGDADTGEVYIQKNDSAVLPVASMSKLVTAFAATDILDPATRVTITAEETRVPPDASNLQAGETYTVRELLYPMLLNSSNVAAEALASTTNRSHFLELMSSYAWEVGMPGAFFADPSGVDPRNAASAKDVFALAQYLVKYRPDILAVTRTPRVDAATTTDHSGHRFGRIHPFVHAPAFLGGKTGHTPEAKDTMMTIMSIGGRKVAIVVLASDDRAADTRKLIAAAGKQI